MELNYAMNTCIHLSDAGHSKENAAVLALTSHYSFLVMLVGSLPGVIFAVFTGKDHLLVSYHEYRKKRVNMIIKIHVKHQN